MSAHRARTAVWVLALALILPAAERASANARHWKVSYVTLGGHDSEWRIVDPATSESTVLAKVFEGPLIHWDPDFREAEFAYDGKTFRLRWEQAALPWPRLGDGSATSRAPRILWSDLEGQLSADRWGGTPKAIPPPQGEFADQGAWEFVPSRSVPGTGLAMRVVARPNGPRVRMPMYFLDRRHGAQRVVDLGLGPPAFANREFRLLMAERDGFLLIDGSRIWVLDLHDGTPSVVGEGHCGKAVWVPAPNPAREDAAGLRRLRARFR